MTKDAADTHNCSFCFRPSTEVGDLASSGTAVICLECAKLCIESILDARRGGETSDCLTPQEIVRRLDEMIIGQERAKRTLAVAIYNHQKRISGKLGRNAEVEKSNILLVGPTGTGKTLLAKTIAKMLDVPFAMVDATSLTESGYVGDDVETALHRLLEAANGEVARAEKGIIYIDEIDKISCRGENRSISRDVSGEGVQQALLKLLEGHVVNVMTEGNRKTPGHPMVTMDTSNILFICGGAFSGLESIIQERMAPRSIGFGAQPVSVDTNKAALTDATVEDLIKFGMIPEFLGRLPILATLDELTVEDLKLILTEPKNAIVRQYKSLLAVDGVDLHITDGALQCIAEEAIERKLGARGLRSMMEKLLEPIMFDAPNQSNKMVVIGESVVRGEMPTWLERKAA